MSTYEIRLLGPDDVDTLVAHSSAHHLESGTEGELPYGPHSRSQPRDTAEYRARIAKRWSVAPAEPGWGRAWGLLFEGAVVGAVHLAGGELRATLHRVDLGIGIVRAHRDRGWGKQLMLAAIDWAREEPALDWIDLGVFEGNHRALALYQKLGFVQRGRTVDLFRVDGVSITEIHMSLAVK